MLIGNKRSAIAAHTTLLSSRIRHTQPAAALLSPPSSSLLLRCRLSKGHRGPVSSTAATASAPASPAIVECTSVRSRPFHASLQLSLPAHRTRLYGITRSSTISGTAARVLATVLRVFTIHGIASACGRSAMRRSWPMVAPEAFFAS